MDPIPEISASPASVGSYGSDTVSVSSEDAFRRALDEQKANPGATNPAAEKRDGTEAADSNKTASTLAALTRPGDCTYAKHDELQAEVNRACKGASARCEDTDSSQTLNEKIDMHSACIAARQRINATCYRGGNAGHQQAVEAAQNGLNRCYRKLEQAQKREANSSVAASDQGFLKRMEQVTGLTGVALGTYLLLSEGSRVILPPRNLVPLP